MPLEGDPFWGFKVSIAYLFILSNLYRCHARVAYKPFRSNYAIVFEERQIQSLRVNLAANFSDIVKQDNTFASGLFNTESNSCVVTLSDPYLDGVAWTSLNEINSLTGLATTANQDALAGYLKRKCEPGESPADGCFPYALIDSKGSEENLATTERSKPTLILTLWYVIGGDKNQVIETTFYFDLVATSIKHGVSGEPAVTLSGKAAYDIKFQQNLQPTFFDQGKNWVDEFNEKMFFKEEGFELEDVCSDPANEVKMDRVYRVNNLTPAQILNKFMSTVEGSQVLSLPTREFANKIQICTKADNFCYGSTVFYLGKGLYEQYKINVQIPNNDVNRNARPAPPNIEGPKGTETEYRVSIPDPETTAKQLENLPPDASTVFAPQFVDIGDYSDPVVLKGSGNKETFKIEKLEKVAAFGDAKGAIAYYGGEVLSVNEAEKSVKIKSNFYIQYCNSDDKCNRATLYQEYRKLKSISVKETDKLSLGASVGEAETGDPQKVSKTRLYVVLSTKEEVVMAPSDLPRMISTYEGASDLEKKEEAPTDGTGDKKGRVVARVGWTGSTMPAGENGTHLHTEWRPNSRSISRADVEKYVELGSGYGVTGSYNEVRSPTRRHKGIDFGGMEPGTPIYLKGGATVINAVTVCKNGDASCSGGFGNNILIDTPEGQMLLAHLEPGSIDEDIPEYKGGARETTSSTSGKAKNGNQQVTSDKNATNISTEFKGVPKALRIIPGRTVLSLITDYDAWIQNGKSSDIDPNIWITNKFKSWYIGGAEYSWDRGDLRVKVKGYLPWSLQEEGLTGIPSWVDYKEDKGYVDYYDYIRSGGDLCYTNKNNKNSCSECSKTPQSFTSPSGSADSVSSTYSSGKFTYTGSNQEAVQSLLNASEAAGVKSNIGQAAIIGNAQKESFASLDPTAVGDDGTALGVFQWRADRQDNLRALGNAPLSREQQMRWFVKEMQDYPSLVNYLNRSDITLDQAVREFGRVYLRPGDPDYPTRIKFAQDILNNMR